MSAVNSHACYAFSRKITASFNVQCSSVLWPNSLYNLLKYFTYIYNLCNLYECVRYHNWYNWKNAQKIVCFLSHNIECVFQKVWKLGQFTKKNERFKNFQILMENVVWDEGRPWTCDWRVVQSTNDWIHPGEFLKHSWEIDISPIKEVAQVSIHYILDTFWRVWQGSQLGSVSSTYSLSSMSTSTPIKKGVAIRRSVPRCWRHIRESLNECSEGNFKFTQLQWIKLFAISRNGGPKNWALKGCYHGIPIWANRGRFLAVVDREWSGLLPCCRWVTWR